jgi:PAS domain-containing protein
VLEEKMEEIMSDKKMLSIPYGQFSMEMRSGRIINIDEGFTKLLGYDDEDVKTGLIFKTLVPDVEYNEIIAELREQFIATRYACYKHEALTKSGNTIEIVSFFTIQNKLLDGHRVLEVGIADISYMINK